jgi:HEAT repeat protein
MRHALFVMFLIASTGCRQTAPTMAGAKWAEALRDPSAKVRKKAVFTLGNIGPSDPAVFPALVSALKDAHPEVRREAILALLKYGAGAKEAIPALTEAQEKDRDAKVRAYAAKVLEKLRDGV